MKKLSSFTSHQKGQALILLIIFTAIGSLIISSAIILSLVNASATDKLYQGSNAIDIAESGAETAMIKLLRDDTYKGETMTIGDGQAVITVTGSSPYLITSIGIRGNFRRKIQVQATYVQNVLTVTSWKEI